MQYYKAFFTSVPYIAGIRTLQMARDVDGVYPIIAYIVAFITIKGI